MIGSVGAVGDMRDAGCGQEDVGLRGADQSSVAFRYSLGRRTAELVDQADKLLAPPTLSKS